jgi:predicted Zn-dependent peptidase
MSQRFLRTMRSGAFLLLLAALGGAATGPAAVRADSAQGQGPQKETPPAPGPPKGFTVPPRTTIPLPNGLQLTLVPYGHIPKAAVVLEVRTGLIDEGPDDVTLSSVVADMLLEGTTTRSAQDISRQAADMGGSLSANAGDERTTIGGEVLSDFADRFVTLIADVARSPRVAPADLKRILDKHARDNAIALASPQSQAQKKFNEMMYGSHPFSHTFPAEATLRGFTVERVRAFHGRNFGAARARLYVSGVFDAAKVEQAARSALGTWPAGAPPTVNPPAVAGRRAVALVDRPKSQQSSIWLGVPVQDPAGPDWIRLGVTDALLGGAFVSRITVNIREDKGYAYSPYSVLSADKGSAIWVEIADVTTAVTGKALTEILKEIERLRAEAPPAQEVEGIRNSLAGTFVIRNSSRLGLIGQLRFVDLHGLGDAYLSTYVKNVFAVSPEDVRVTAAKYLDPAKASIAIVGDRRAVEPQIASLR